MSRVICEPSHYKVSWNLHVLVDNQQKFFYYVSKKCIIVQSIHLLYDSSIEYYWYFFNGYDMWSVVLNSVDAAVRVCVDVNITFAKHVHWSSTKSRHGVLSVANKPAAFLIQPKVRNYCHLMDIDLWSFHSVVYLSFWNV